MRYRRFNQVKTILALSGLTVCFALVARWLTLQDQNVVRAAIATNAPTAGFHAELRTEPSRVKADAPVKLSFLVKNSKGAVVRFLQFVHEKPMHLLVVSEDLAEFYHIHPEMQVDDAYGVEHIFPHGGRYRLYADYTPPGSQTIVEQFELNVAGPARTRENLKADASLTKEAQGLRVTAISEKPLRAGEDLMLKFALSDVKTGQPVNNLQLYLGALAHFVVISEDLKSFIHAHPLDAGEVLDPSRDPSQHVHDPAQLAKKLVGPSPSEVSAYVNFPHAGLYKLWAQFERDGKVITVPFVLNVGEAACATSGAATPIPADAIKINVGSSGYEPSEISVKKGEKVTLAFTRTDSQNCAGTVLFPQLNISRQLAVGETVLIELTPNEAGQINFSCGMGMFKGKVIVN
ncbi:MAG: cupredoxin domain-containing protein [Acidobacteriota bacterium]|nr:cupredoxin domain-containing protein [Acidobacteriota bacterium]